VSAPFNSGTANVQFVLIDETRFRPIHLMKLSSWLKPSLPHQIRRASLRTPLTSVRSAMRPLLESSRGSLARHAPYRAPFIIRGLRGRVSTQPPSL